jgi:hydrogenase maturation protease
MKGRKLVIGYGNPLRGDDGLGWDIAGRLAATIPDKAIAIMAVHQLTPELAEPISEVEMVIFVDASYEGRPGTWKCEEVKPAPVTTSALGHHFDVSGLLAYVGAVFDASPQAFIVSVAAESFECHDHLTPAVERVLPEIVRHIRGKVGALNPNPQLQATHA